MRDIDNLDLSVKRPYIPQRRDSEARLSRELDDLFALYVFLDEHRSINKLPKYVSDNPDAMPNTRLYEGDMLSLMNMLREIQDRQAGCESALAAICSDVRKLQARPYVPESTGDAQSTAQLPPVSHSQNWPSLSAETNPTMTVGISNAAVSVPVNDQSAGRSWSAMTSTPVMNRFAVLSSVTDDDDDYAGEQHQQPYETVGPRRNSKRSRQQRTPTEQPAMQRPDGSRNQRRAPLLRGKATASSVVSAADKLRRKYVFCVDNVSSNCTVDHMKRFIKSMSVTAVSCFEVRSRRRRTDSAGGVNRKAFRVCVQEDEISRFLNPEAWPDSITISEWFFKSRPQNNDNSDATEVKKRRVDGHSQASSMERDERLGVENDHPVDSVRDAADADAAEVSAAESPSDDTVIVNPNVSMDTINTENNGGC